MSQRRGSSSKWKDDTRSTASSKQSRDPPSSTVPSVETLNRSLISAPTNNSTTIIHTSHLNPSFSHTHSHANSVSGVSGADNNMQYPRFGNNNNNLASTGSVMSLSHAYSHVRSIGDYHATHNDQATSDEDGQPTLLHTGEVITAKNTVQSYSILALPAGGSSSIEQRPNSSPRGNATPSSSTTSWPRTTPPMSPTRGITTTTSTDDLPLRQPRQPRSVSSSEQQQYPSTDRNRSMSSLSMRGGDNGDMMIHNEKTTLDSRPSSRSGGAIDPDGVVDPDMPSVGLAHRQRSLNSSGMTMSSSHGGTTSGAVIAPSSSVVSPTIIEFASPPIWATADQPDAVEATAVGFPMSRQQLHHNPLDTVTTMSGLSSHRGMNVNHPSNTNMNTIHLHDAMTTSSQARSAPPPTNERKNSVIPILLVILILVVLAGVVIAGVCVSGKCSDDTNSNSAAASSSLRNSSPAPAVTSSAVSPPAPLTTGSLSNTTLNNSIAPVSAPMEIVNSIPTSSPVTRSDDETESTNSPSTTTAPIVTSLSNPTISPMSGTVASNETTTTNVPQPTIPPTTSAPSTSAPIRLTLMPTTRAPTLAPVTTSPTMATATSQPTLAPLSSVPTRGPTTLAPVSLKPTREPTTLRPTPQPTSAPISAKAARAAKIASYINNVTFSGRTIQYDSATTANLPIHERALKWLIEDDPMQLVPDTQLQRFQMRQRYALRTMFVQQDTNNKWTNVSGWATGADECTWVGVSCLRRQVSGESGLRNTVSHFSVSNNNVQGVLADDLGLISTLNLFVASGSKLRGTLPSSLGRWTSLGYLDLNANQLTGSLPASVGNWKDLFTIYLQGNEFTGSLPSTISKWSNMQFIDLGPNYFTGTIPASIGTTWTNLVVASFDANVFTGSIPNGLCNNPGTSIDADCNSELTCSCCDSCY